MPTSGNKIAEPESGYVDTATDLPSFVTVKVGMPARHGLVFVPLDRATAGLGYLKVGRVGVQGLVSKRSTLKPQ